MGVLAVAQRVRSPPFARWDNLLPQVCSDAARALKVPARSRTGEKAAAGRERRSLRREPFSPPAQSEAEAGGSFWKRWLVHEQHRRAVAY